MVTAPFDTEQNRATLDLAHELRIVRMAFHATDLDLQFYTTWALLRHRCPHSLREVSRFSTTYALAAPRQHVRKSTAGASDRLRICTAQGNVEATVALLADSTESSCSLGS